MSTTIKISLLDKQVIAVYNGQIFGQVYSTRSRALEVYFKEAAHLESLGILDPESSIIN